MKINNALKLVVIILVSGLLGYFFGVNKVNLDWKNYKPSIKILNQEPPSGLSAIDFSLFWTVWQKIELTYYDKTKLDGKKMLNGAIDGMIQSLGDPFTVYLPPVQNTNFKQGLAGQFSGIGAELGTKDKQIIVIAPLDDSPAKKQGIKAGDLILKVDGVSTNGWSLAQTVDKIRGLKGTSVTLNILHKDAQSPINIAIVRDTITVKSVVSNLKYVKKNAKGGIDVTEDKCDECQKVGYVRLSQFGDATNQDWLAVVNKLNLEMKNAKNVKGLVFDLRDNPGGYLTDAVFIASEFIKPGMVVVEEEDSVKNITKLSVNRQGLFYDIPLIVLVNKGSASASEIVSGALRDNKRAKLVGENSFGKGTVQQAEDLGDGAGLHVTVAKWLTPNGTWVNNIGGSGGLKPDVTVSLDPKDPSKDTQLEKAVEELLK